MNELPAKFNFTGAKALRIGRLFYWRFDLPWATLNKSYAAKIKDTDGNAVATFTMTKDDVNNYIYIQLLSATTATLSPGLYRYDIKQTDSTAEPVNIMEGAIEIVKTVT